MDESHVRAWNSRLVRQRSTRYPVLTKVKPGDIEYGISRNFKPYPKQKEAFFVLKIYPYNREKAAVYAKKWAFEVVYGVRKDAGDDVDVTNRLLICAEVSFFPGREILVEGGEGVGRVTRPGLEQPPGAAA